MIRNVPWCLLQTRDGVHLCACVLLKGLYKYGRNTQASSFAGIMGDTLTDLYAIPSPEQLDIRKASIISTDSYTDERLDFCPVGLKQKEV